MCQCVRQVAKVDARDDLLGTEVDEQLPERLALALCVQVPDRVDHRGGSQVDRALLGPDPTKLAVADERAPEGAHVGEHVLERASDHERPQRFDGGDADLVAASDREGEAVPSGGLVVGADDHVGRRVVGVRVHRVRAVE